MLNVLDLFSGIGGFSLGLERTGGFRTVAFCEIEPFCRSVLNKHWPGVPVYEDVKTLDAARLAADGISVDVLCGGFPCQDISTAGRGAGLSGERSGLWWEFYRLIQEIRPQYALIENVSALRSRGLDEVLGALAAIGYDAEWHCIPASAVGAPHRRDRVWIVAYPNSAGSFSSAFTGIHCGETGAGAWDGEPQRLRGASEQRSLADPISIACGGGAISFSLDQQKRGAAQAGGEGIQPKHRQTRPDHAEQSSADVADPTWDGARRSRIGAFAGGESIVGPVGFGTQCAESAAELRNPPSAASDGVGGGPPTDVAHPQHEGWGAGGVCRHGEAPSALGVRQASPVVRPSADVADTHIVVGNARWSGDVEQSAGRRDAGGSDCGADGMADADCAGLERQWRIAGRVGAQFADVGSGGWWATEPDVGRVAHGVPARVDRLRALGNAVVPQIPEILGRAILAHRASSDL